LGSATDKCSPLADLLPIAVMINNGGGHRLDR
jgi:hypothetical protein